MNYLFICLLFLIFSSAHAEQRDEVTFQRGPDIQKFYKNFIYPGHTKRPFMLPMEALMTWPMRPSLKTGRRRIGNSRKG